MLVEISQSRFPVASFGHLIYLVWKIKNVIIVNTFFLANFCKLGGLHNLEVLFCVVYIKI